MIMYGLSKYDLIVWLYLFFTPSNKELQIEVKQHIVKNIYCILIALYTRWLHVSTLTE